MMSTAAAARSVHPRARFCAPDRNKERGWEAGGEGGRERELREESEIVAATHRPHALEPAGCCGQSLAPVDDGGPHAPVHWSVIAHATWLLCCWGRELENVKSGDECLECGASWCVALQTPSMGPSAHAWSGRMAAGVVHTSIAATAPRHACMHAYMRAVTGWRTCTTGPLHQARRFSGFPGACPLAATPPRPRASQPRHWERRRAGWRIVDSLV